MIFGIKKLESWGYHARYLRDSTFSHFDTKPECDRHTHRHTTMAYTALRIASCGKNPRDSNQFEFAVLSRQMYRKSWRFAVEAFLNATSSPFSYLLVDLRPDLEDEWCRLRINIFPGKSQYVYVRKKERYTSRVPVIWLSDIDWQRCNTTTCIVFSVGRWRRPETLNA